MEFSCFMRYTLSSWCKCARGVVHGYVLPVGARCDDGGVVENVSTLAVKCNSINKLSTHQGTVRILVSSSVNDLPATTAHTLERPNDSCRRPSVFATPTFVCCVQIKVKGQIGTQRDTFQFQCVCFIG